MYQKIKKFIEHAVGLEKYSDYVRNYFHRTNLIATIYMASVIIVLETWMLLLMIHYYVTGSRTTQWLFSHTVNYVLLISIAILVLIYSIRYIRGKTVNHVFGYISIGLLCLGSIIFGINVSRVDYSKGEQILCFVTMMIFSLCILTWRPIVFFSLLSSSFLVMAGIMISETGEPLSVATKINFFTLWVAMLMLGLEVYFHRLKEARKDESLEATNRHLHELAITDELTGIPNARYFHLHAREELSKPGVDPEGYVFLFTDIENFGNYNEQYGYDAGNVLLMQTANLLHNAFPDSLMARQSDDHFILLIPRDGIAKIQDIHRELTRTGNEIRISLKSGGYIPHSADVDSNMACDRARYACRFTKKRFNCHYREYDESMDQVFHKRQYIINHIDQAIERGYIKPYYQPVVWSENGMLCGFEALARWNDPEYGFLSPGDFIPVLEEYKQIHKLDRFIMEMVCIDIREGIETGEPLIPVSLNFSRVDFEMEDIPTLLDETLSKYGIEKDLIHVEITESALTEHHNVLGENIHRLQEMGYAIWLDDFGSGYSALNVLKDFHFDVLKIDMAFITNFESTPKSKPIIRSIVQLAESISSRTLTEGVETQAQVDFLHEIGCERLQGYLFGKPMPRDQIRNLIASGALKVSGEFLTNP